MALIPPFFLDCVVAIGVKGSDESKSWIGTGFIVGKYFKKNVTNNTTQYHLFLVTNKHVLKDQQSIIVRINPQPQNGNAAKDYEVPLIDKDAKPLWTGHPEVDVDVAAISIIPHSLLRDEMKFEYFRSDKNLLKISQMADMGLAEGDFVYVLGYPMGLVDPDIQYVFSRMGSIARIRDLLEKRRKTYFIDAFVFPGNSGGPVICKPEFTCIEGTKAIKNAYLIGMVSSYVPYNDIAISQQTRRPRVIFEENSGLTYVIPTDYIMKTIDICFKTNESILVPSEETGKEVVKLDNN